MQRDPAGRAGCVEGDDQRFVFELAGMGELVIARSDDLVAASPQRGTGSAQGDQSLEFVQQVGVPGLGMVPGEAPRLAGSWPPVMPISSP